MHNLQKVLALCLLLRVTGVEAISTPLFNGGASEKQAVETPLDAQLRIAYEALAQKNLNAARQAQAQAAKLAPDNTDVMLLQAEIARVANKPKEVEETLQRALRVAPKSPDTLSAWSRWLFAQGKMDESEKFLRQAIEAKPDLARLHTDLGDFLLSQRNNPTQAQTAFQRAIELDPKSAGAQVGLGSAAVALGDKKTALAAFAKAAQLAPKTPQPHIGMARVLGSERRYREAEEAFARALALRGDLYAIMVERADTLLLDGRRPEAIKRYRETVTAAPKFAIAQMKLGMALQQDGQSKEAFAAYQEALKLDPKSAPTLNNLAVLSAETGENLAQGIKWAQQAVALAPKMPSFLETQAWVMQRSGKLQEALTLLDAQQDKLPASATLQYRRGLLLEALDKKDLAAAAYRQALQIQPNFEQARDAAERVAKLSAKKS